MKSLSVSLMYGAWTTTLVAPVSGEPSTSFVPGPVPSIHVTVLNV